MKKRIISLLVAMALLFSLIPNVIAARSELERGGGFDENGGIITGRCGETVFYSINIYTGVFDIYGEGPMFSYMEYSGWRYLRNYIHTLEIAEGVTTIGRNSFMDFEQLISVYLPSTLTTIEENAFYGCRSLHDIYGGTNLTAIESQAFAFCANLLNVTLGPSIGSISSYAFYDCEDLNRITIMNPNCLISNEPGTLGVPEVTTIRGLCNSTAFDYAMYHGHNFEALDHQHSFTVTEAEPTCTEPGFTLYSCECGTAYYANYVSAFGHSYTDGVCTTCGQPALEYSGVCGPNLTWVYREDTKELIIEGSGEMYSYSDLPAWGPIIRDIESVSLPEGIRNIGALAFENCINLTEVHLPDSVEQVGENAFLGCENLSTVKFGPAIYAIGKQAFALCSLTEAVLPASIDHIVSAAFHGCPLTKIVIPNTDCIIGDMATTLGDPETTVIVSYVDSTAQEYAERYGYTFEIDSHTHIFEPIEVEPTCTDLGYITYLCIECGYSFDDNFVNPIGHDYIDGACVNCGEPEPSTEDPSEPEAPSEPVETGTPEEPTEPDDGVELPDDPITPEDPSEEVTEELPSEEATEETPSENITEEVPEEEPTEEASKEDPSEEPSKPEEVPTEPSEAPDEPSTEPSEPEIPKDNPFADVKDDDYFAKPVLWAVGKGITNGMSETSFAPNSECTRAQIVTFLWRASGSPEPTNADNPFKDVSADAYYYKAVLWAVEKGVTTGLSATTFGPNATCTRGQVATFLWRAQGQPEPTNTKNPFKDVAAKDYYTKAVLWAVENEVTQGVGGDSFAPNASCTRGQIVTFLFRAIA